MGAKESSMQEGTMVFTTRPRNVQDTEGWSLLVQKTGLKESLPCPGLSFRGFFYDPGKAGRLFSKSNCKGSHLKGVRRRTHRPQLQQIMVNAI